MIYLLIFSLFVLLIFIIFEIKKINKHIKEYNELLLRKNNALLVLLRNKDLISKDDMEFIDEVVKNKEKSIMFYLKNPFEPFFK